MADTSSSQTFAQTGVQTLSAITPFAALLAAAPARKDAGAGLTVREHVGLGLATVAARKDAIGALTNAVRDAFGVMLQDAPVASGGTGVVFIGTGPGMWLAVSRAVSPGGGWRFARDLAATLDGCASVSDQSSGYGVLRLSGPAVRKVLAKGAPIDLHPGVFLPGGVAVTDVAHVGAIVWRVDGTPMADPQDADGGAFDIAVFRSLAGSFWHWLEESAAEFGVTTLG